MIKTTIDIGTNTILMLIAEYDESNSEVKTILDIQRIPRLGKGVDANRNILPESIRKAIDILNEYKQISLDFKSTGITATATSFLRDSKNKEDFIESIKENTGIEIEVLSGENEAKWTFIGGIYDKVIYSAKPQMLTTIDIGGGSTEITAGKVSGTSLGEILSTTKPHGRSFDIGSVRINEKFLSSHPPVEESIKKAEEFILSHYSQFDRTDEFDKSKLIGIAGTITTLGTIKLGLDKFDAGKVDNLELTLNDIKSMLKMLSSKSLQELYALGNHMEGRADIIIPGTLILKCFMEKYRFDKLTISTKGLRYGVFLREVIL